MKVNYAIITSRWAYLSEDFGKELAMRKFNLTEEELELVVGRYVRGKRKGLLKGMLIWSKCIKGGWVKDGPYDFDRERACGHIEGPGRTFDYQLVDSWTRQPYHWNQDEIKKKVTEKVL